MSDNLYELFGGKNQNEDVILDLLKLNKSSFVRYCSISVDYDYVVVHTKCGNIHRIWQQEMYESMRSHGWYSHDKDWMHNNHYADIYFRIPDDETKSLFGLLGLYNTGISTDDLEKLIKERAKL
jgi:hypothetical protein